ncbi:uncharacterized protein LOC134778578 [Penaeus indicus]|uniref:uncharacterized protein LOC134778578 n=1 Tax=Penaeus indicus TaxID=29960 RepID=UPI00300C09C7
MRYEEHIARGGSGAPTARWEATWNMLQPRNMLITTNYIRYKLNSLRLPPFSTGPSEQRRGQRRRTISIHGCDFWSPEKLQVKYSMSGFICIQNPAAGFYRPRIMGGSLHPFAGCSSTTPQFDVQHSFSGERSDLTSYAQRFISVWGVPCEDISDAYGRRISIRPSNVLLHAPHIMGLPLRNSNVISASSTYVYTVESDKMQEGEDVYKARAHALETDVGRTSGGGLVRVSTERTGLATVAGLEEEKPATAHPAHRSAVARGNFSALVRRLAVRTIPSVVPPHRRNSVTTRGGMEEVDYMVVEEEWELHKDDFSGVPQFMNVVAGIMVVSAAVGICANLYVVCAASTSLKSNVVNVYVLHRTLAQLLFLLFTPTLAAHILLLGWTFGDVFCRMTVGFVHIAEYAEIFFLIAMSVDGHKAFDTYSTDTRLRDSKIAAATIWVLAILLGAPLFALFGTVQGPDGMAFCTLLYINWGTIVMVNHVHLLPILIALVVPCALLPGMFPPRDGRRRELSDEALAARRLVLALVASFWLFRLPYAITQFCATLTHYFNPTLITALHLTAVLPYVNAAVDPVIYIVLRRSLASPRAAAHTRGVEITYVNLIPEL